ncbi:hypothetical protein FQN50_009126 [Emmonsiellopsis sp. PD_5]|nr:hypothetical protein FQN50_009126 [Emmonsiellopsis sp. PD_5]
MAGESALTHDIVLSLLRPTFQTVTEEDQHPWGDNSLLIPKPLLRIWDSYSGSQPKQTNRMISRSPRQHLDTLEARKKYLTIHADHRKWTPTPFISLTTSAEAAQELADSRAAKRGAQTITVANPNVRIANGLPMLDMDAEMHHYGIPDPYKRSNKYYKDHYLCLWEITESEVVAHWQWDHLVENDHWYEKIVLPEFGTHNERFFAGPPEGEALDLSALLDALPSTPPTSEKPRRARLTGLAVDDPSDPDDFFNEWDTSSEELSWQFEDEFDQSDTDDEVEEANATDDMFKILEGDW